MAKDKTKPNAGDRQVEAGGARDDDSEMDESEFDEYADLEDLLKPASIAASRKLATWRAIENAREKLWLKRELEDYPDS